MTAPAIDPVARFARTGARHRFTAREVVVSAVEELNEAFFRVTFEGPDLHDFVSSGPGDHTRIYFPHPVSGELLAPSPVGPDADGIERPEGPMFARDFTPLNVRTDESTGARSFDVDFLRHPNEGPAATWAATAKPGDRLVAVGPRGSRHAVQGAGRVLLAVDASALPAASRWIADVPATTRIEVVADVSPTDLDWVEEYLVSQGGRAVDVYEVFGTLGDAVRDAGVDEDTFIFAAGEATRLIPLRKLLKYELGLPREQYAISGYWKRGMVAFDHHAPIDPEDPED